MVENQNTKETKMDTMQIDATAGDYTGQSSAILCCAAPHDAQGVVPFVPVKSCLSLEVSMTKHEARPHLVMSYLDMRSSAFDEYLPCF